MENKLVMFDCFGVILNPVIHTFWHKFLPNVDFEICKDYCAKGDIGVFNFKEEVELIAKTYGLDPVSSYNFVIDCAKANMGVVEIIRKLNKKYHVVLVSNAPEGEVETLFEKLNLTDLFEHLYVSWQYKDAKPNLSFYKKAIDDYNATDIVMIDDTKNNLMYLADINVKSILYNQDNDELVANLNKLGFNI